MRRVYVTVEVDLIIDIDEGVELSHVIDEMDYGFSDTTGSANIIDSVIENYEIKDVK